MRRIEVHPQDKYGDLTIIREVESTGKRRFLCKCACGAEVEVRLSHLRSGHTSSCGRCGLDFGGERRTLRGWAQKYGIKETTLRARLKTMKLGEALRR